MPINDNKIVNDVSEPNKVNELWPDSIYGLGNETLTRKYSDLLKSNYKRLMTKVETLKFLLDVTWGLVIKQDVYMSVSYTHLTLPTIYSV